MYTIIDLLDKVIAIEEKGYEMYTLISKLEGIDANIKVVARILAAEEKRHAQVYRDIKAKAEQGDTPSIDFGTYDKASNLFNNFKYPVTSHLKDIDELLHFALDFEEQGISLVMSIRGLLIQESTDSATVTYEVLSQVIEEEEKHIENIENFLR